MARYKCKRCNKTKVRLFMGRYTRNKTKMYVDEKGYPSTGLICPVCMAQPLPKHKAEGPNFETDPLTNRLCRECCKPLPTSRYFMHSECRDRQETVYESAEDWGYCVRTGAS